MGSLLQIVRRGVLKEQFEFGKDGIRVADGGGDAKEWSILVRVESWRLALSGV